MIAKHSAVNRILCELVRFTPALSLQAGEAQSNKLGV
jgi:hypothetical protein